MGYSYTELIAFFLVLTRVSVFLTLWPVLGTPNVPMYAKVLLSVLISMIIFPMIVWKQIFAEIQTEQLIVLIVREAMIAASLAFIAKCLFYIVEVCGQSVSMAIGLSNAQMMNPLAGNSSNVIEQFYYMMLALFFLSINGHHYFVAALIKSFEIVPLSLEFIDLMNVAFLTGLIKEVFLVGVQLSAPVMISILVLNIAMGLVGRAVPQINVLITSIPVSILFGLAVMMVSLPAVMIAFKGFLNTDLALIFKLLKEM